MPSDLSIKITNSSSSARLLLLQALAIAYYIALSQIFNSRTYRNVSTPNVLTDLFLGHCMNSSEAIYGYDVDDKRNWIDEERSMFARNLRAECAYHGDRYGLFHPDTPWPRYLITGGAGFIGGHLIKGLRAAGVCSTQIKVVDNLYSGRLANFQYVNGSWAINATRDLCVLDLRRGNF
jgi:hypothetical protein